MKTELEKKLNKLPAYIRDKDFEDVIYNLYINKTSENAWMIAYSEYEYWNTLIRVVHTSLQAAVDTTLKEIKNL